MTPLEKAREMTCRKCQKMEVVGEIAYCSVNGKILLPSLLDTCVCRGERLKESDDGREVSRND